jgi:hypothetical protein
MDMANPAGSTMKLSRDCFSDGICIERAPPKTAWGIEAANTDAKITPM